MHDERAAAREIERLSQTGGVLGTRAWRSLVHPLLLCAPGLAALYGAVQVDSVIGYQIGILLLALGAIWGMLVLWSLRKPTLAFTREGLRAASYGFIPWESIDGLLLTSISPPILDFYVPELSRFASKMSLLGRLRVRMRIGPYRSRLRFVLSTSFRRAELLKHVAESLWQSRTGRENHWIPNDPLFTSKMRQIADAQKRGQLEQSIALYDELVEQLNARKASEERSARWAIAIAVVVFVAIAAYRVFSAYVS